MKPPRLSNLDAPKTSVEAPAQSPKTPIKMLLTEICQRARAVYEQITHPKHRRPSQSVMRDAQSTLRCDHVPQDEEKLRKTSANLSQGFPKLMKAIRSEQ